MGSKDWVIITLSGIVALLTFLLIHDRIQCSQAEIADSEFMIRSLLSMRESNEKGDERWVENTLNMLLLGEVRDYQKNHPDATVSNSFEEVFHKAESIADEVEASLVPLR